MRRSLGSLLVLLACCLSLSAQILMPKTKGQSRKERITTPTPFYDDGGATANASSSTISAITFSPKYGETIEVNFSELDLGGGTLYVYTGAEKLQQEYDDEEDEMTYSKPSAKPLYTLTSASTLPQLIHATTADGTLTFVYEGGAKPGKGWVAEVKSVAKRAGDQPTPLDPAGTVQMVWGDREVQIGTEALKFYDDGGKTGKISEGFEGSVTFVPKTQGEIIQLTFDKLNLFSTNPAKNDLLKVFNGRSYSDPAKLLRTLLTDRVPATLLSGESDGSLTVYLKSRTGIPFDGFEATVQAVTPKEMTFVSATTTAKPIKESPHAGAKEVELLSLLIKTDGATKALQLEELTFDLTGTSAGVLSELTLYAGTSATPGQRLGTLLLSPSGNSATLLLEEGKRPLLDYGTNTFTIAGSVSEHAQTGDKIALKLSTVKLSGQAHPTTLPATASLTITNTYKSSEKAQTITVYSPWTFTHTTGFQGKYAGGRVDQVTTFVPGKEGELVELDFSSFDVVYSKTSYGAKAVFKVYSGKTHTGTPLWELNAQTMGTIPPLLRSQSTDGALTVVFNPKESSTAHLGKGWLAQVRSLTPSPMRLVKTVVSQASSANVSVGATDQEFLAFTLTTAGQLEPKRLEKVQLHLKGGASAFSKLHLYRLTSPKELASRTLLGEVTPTTGDDVTLALTEALTLPEQESHFLLTADISDTTTEGKALDLSLTSLTLSGEAMPVTAGDPAGERIAERIYRLPNGAKETRAISAPLHFYDLGGPDASHPAGYYGTVTFTPRKGELIHLKINNVSLHRLDTLYIYSGARIIQGKELRRYTGSYNPNLQDIISTATDGSLTIHYSGKSVAKGWDMVVNSIPITPLEGKAVALAPVSPAPRLLPGVQAAPLLRLDITIEGTRGKTELTQLDLADLLPAGAKSPWATFSLYDTGNIQLFSTTKLVGSTSTASPTTITGKVSYSKAGTYHLFLTANVAPEAQAGADSPELTLAPSTVTIGGKTVSVTPLKAPLKLTLTQGVHGTFVVGNSSEATYKTLMDAAKDLRSKGVDGAVTLQLLPGAYDENVLLTHIPGLSPTNRLTIELRDKGSQVTFENKHYQAIEYGNGKLGYFTLDSISYVTFRGLSFVTGSTKPAPSLVQVQNRSQHIIFEDCSFKAPKATDYSNGDIALVRSQEGTSPYPSNDGLTFRSCRFEGGYTGINASGTGKIHLPGQHGLTIEDCSFTAQGAKSIYAPGMEDLLIKGNRIDISGDIAVGYIAIDATALGKTLIEKNRIHIGETSGKGSALEGISLRESLRQEQVRGTTSIFNNEIIIQSHSDRVAAIGIQIGGANIAELAILHNSVRLHGSSPSMQTAAFVFAPRGKAILSGLRLKNNLFQNEAKGAIFRFSESAELKRQSIGDNVYSIEGDKLAKYQGKDLNLISWRTTASDLSSKVFKTDFATPETSLLPKDFSKLTFAQKLREVPTDILGTARKANRTAVGAYEERTITLPALREGYPQPIVSAGVIKGLRIKVSEPGKLHYLIKEAGATAPTLDELKQAPATPSLSLDVEQTIDVAELEGNSSYVFYYLAEGADGTLGSEVKSVPFDTPATALRTADFEETAVGAKGFTAGSWKFSGVEVVTPDKSYSANSKHALKLDASSTIELKNKRQAFVHDGFYLRSQGTLTLTATGEGDKTQSKTFPSTDGKWYYVGLRDLGAFTSLSLSSTGETLIDDFGTTPQALSLSASDQQGKSGEAITLTATVTGGVWPYTFRWENSKGETIGSELTPTLTPEHSGSYTLFVTDSWSEVRSVRKQLLLRGKAAVSTFEDLALKPNSNWHGEVSTDPDAPDVSTTFLSGSYAFSNTNIENLQTWGGFAYANQTSKVFKEPFPDQFNSGTGTGANGSKTYAIAYTLGAMTEIRVTHADQATIPGMYLTNSAWVREFARTGKGIVSGEEGLKQGDFFTLKITAQPSGKTLEVPLIDYRSSDSREHYLLEDWQWISLASLGEVQSLRFSLDGSRKNKHGLIIPAYFCLDDFGSEAPAKDASPLALAPNQTQEVALSQLFADAGLPLDVTKPAHYALISTSTGAPVTASISADGKLHLQSKGEGEGSLLLLRRQGGQHSYLRLPLAVSKTTPVDEVTLQQQIQLYPNPATSEIRLQTSGEVAIFSLTGTCLYATKSYQSGDVINVSSWTPGVYLVRTALGTLRFVKR